MEGPHGRYYGWAREEQPSDKTAPSENRVKELVYQEIVDSLKQYVPDLGESHCHALEDRDDAPQAYHTNLIVLPLCRTR